ncbi:MAG: SdpI family protein [Bacillus sp. (in: firmicutes)]
MKKNIYPYVLIGIAFLISIISLPYLPDEIPTHWGMDGQPDDWSSKYFGALLAPVLMLFIAGTMKMTPKIDPMKRNYPKFQKNYVGFKNVLITFFLGIHILTILYGLGYEFSIENFVIIGVGLLFMYLGNIMPTIKPNYFFGIKTPWTLHNERVWTKTHRLGGKLFFTGGLVIILSVFFTNIAAIFILIAIVIILTLSTVIYSFVISR